MTEKQKRFVDEYLIDLNATAAAIRAGYSKRNAGKIGFELLEKTRISEAIQVKIKGRSERTKISQDDVINEIADMAFQDISKDMNAFAKLKALELLGKHLGMFTEKIKTESVGTMEVLWKN